MTAGTKGTVNEHQGDGRFGVVPASSHEARSSRRWPDALRDSAWRLVAVPPNRVDVKVAPARSLRVAPCVAYSLAPEFVCHLALRPGVLGGEGVACSPGGRPGPGWWTVGHRLQSAIPGGAELDRDHGLHVDHHATPSYAIDDLARAMFQVLGVRDCQDEAIEVRQRFGRLHDDVVLVERLFR